MVFLFGCLWLNERLEVPSASINLLSVISLEGPRVEVNTLPFFSEFRMVVLMCGFL